MELIAGTTVDVIDRWGPIALRAVLGLGCLLPPILVWVRSRWWPQPTRGAVRATAVFATVCGMAAIASWYPAHAGGLASGGVTLVLVTVLVLAGTTAITRAFPRHGDLGWQLHIDRLRVLDAALFASKDGVLVAATRTNAVGLQIVYANPAFEELTGYGTEEAVGRSPSMLWNENSPADREAVQAALRAGTPGRFEVRARRKDGSRVWVEWNIVPVLDAFEGCSYRVAVLRDITERRLLEEQLRQAAKLEAVGRLAAGVAHDFNNLLTVIGGNADLLKRTATDLPDAARLVDEVRFATDRAGWLVRQLLTFSRPRPVAREVIDLNQVVSDLSDILRRLLGKGVSTEVDVPADAVPVEADRGQLEQVVMNLAVNARDAMPSGGRLRFAVRAAGGFARLEVSDTGTGMTDDVKAKIFEPFFTTKGPDKGTGLGLATVHRVVQQYGGTIGVESVPGAGTTFRIDLPLSSAAAPAPPSERPSGITRQVGAGASVLLVEDEPGVRALARAILEGRGHRVTEAADGTEALDRLDAGGKYDLVLTDMTMPGAGGEEVAARAQALQPDVGIVFMSGYTESEPVAPGSIYLAKPFSPAGLVRAVTQVLAARRYSSDRRVYSPSADGTGHDTPAPGGVRTVMSGTGASCGVS